MNHRGSKLLKWQYKRIRTLLRVFRRVDVATAHPPPGEVEAKIKEMVEKYNIPYHIVGIKSREWKTRHRIPVVDQGGRVIGYRYLNGGESN